MNRLLAQLESNIEENILTESDCSEQLKNFLELRKKFNRDNDKPYSSLKFSNQIMVAQSDEQIPRDMDPDGQDIEKFGKFLSFNRELLTEKQRRKLFELQHKVIQLLRQFLNRYRSNVKQKGQASHVFAEQGLKKQVRIEVSLKEEEERQMGSIGKEEQNLSSFDRSYKRYYESLKKLKARNESDFMEKIKKLKSIKGKTNVSKFLRDF